MDIAKLKFLGTLGHMNGSMNTYLRRSALLQIATPVFASVQKED